MLGGQDFAADLSDLENMHEAGILHCLRMRFTCGDLSPDAEKVESKYTAFIGNICIAVNPFAPWPYAGSKAWVQYDKRNNPDCQNYNMQHYIDAVPDVSSNKDLEPHCWSVADLAYNTLKKTGKNQAVLICGESGAGTPSFAHACVMWTAGPTRVRPEAKPQRRPPGQELRQGL